MKEIPKTRVSLILRLRHSSDAEAWQDFVEIYQPIIYRLATQKGLQPADARDLTQEVLLRVANAVNEWNPDPEQGSFRGWISRITRNLVVDFLRRNSRLPVTSDKTSVYQLVHSVPQPSVETGLFDFEQERQIFAWAAEKIKPSFNESTWQAFWMTAVDKKTANDVAAELGISRGAVYIARSRVMARLKETIANTKFDGAAGIMKDQKHFSPGLLNDLLNDGLTLTEQSELESHLEICVNCRTQLEQLAADPRQWDKGRQTLIGIRRTASSELDGFRTHGFDQTGAAWR